MTSQNRENLVETPLDRESYTLVRGKPEDQ